jgi:hypothetical protein
MDSLQWWYGCFFTNDSELIDFLDEKLKKYEGNTKFLELQRVFFFKLFLDHYTGNIHFLGIPTLKASEENRDWTYEQVLDQNIAFDEDFDVVIGRNLKLEAKERFHFQTVRFRGDVETNSNGLIVLGPREQLKAKAYFRFQIVRFTGDVEASTDGLFEFIKRKKFDIPKDKNLHLLVLLEPLKVGFEFNCLELFEKLNSKETKVPFGEIFVLGRKKSSNPLVLTFYCRQILPAVVTFKDMNIDFDQPLPVVNDLKH